MLSKLKRSNLFALLIRGFDELLRERVERIDCNAVLSPRAVAVAPSHALRSALASRSQFQDSPALPNPEKCSIQLKMKSICRYLAPSLLLFVANCLVADEAQYLLTPTVTQQQAFQSSGLGPENVDQLPSSRKHPVRAVVSSLAIVLGGFLLLSTVFRKKSPTESKQLATPNSAPNEIMETLGQLQITSKVDLHLVRIGARVLALHLSEDTVQTVCEISDPQEVKTLLGQAARQGAEPDQHPQVGDLLRRVEGQLRETA